MADDALSPLAGFHDLGTADADFPGDVLDGLSRPQKSIPSKYFYDERGSRLFNEICNLPEYFPTRTELAILERHAGEMVAAEAEGATVVEFGSGASVKIRLLLDALYQPAGYLPIDISREHLLESARALASEYPEIAVIPICGDYTGGVHLRAALADRQWMADHLLGFFPGSTIGNFTRDEAVAFLANARDTLESGALIIGVDLIKPEAVLVAAYNDPQGVTAAFNLNLLARINRELGADFDLDGFRHHAPFVAEKGRIEMHLVSTRHQTVTINGHRFTFAPGETIHTENSHKYTVQGFADMAGLAGWRVERCWTDEQRLFSVQRLTRG